MNDYQSGSGGKGIRVAAAAANIARGAAYGGVYGAAAEAAKSFLPELIKLGVILLFVVVLFPLFAFVSLPNILFGFNSSTDQEIIEFTDSAQELTQIYDRATSRTPSILERLVNTILPGFRLPDGSAQYDSYSVTENLGNLNQYWLVAIGSTKYKQDLTAMDEAAVDDLIYGKLDYSTSLIDRVLNITVWDMTPEAYMEKLGFTDEEKEWASLLYSVLVDDQSVSYDDTDGDGYYNTDYGDVTFEHQDTPVVYYNQTDARWGNKLYGKTGTIGAEGCGPTALAGHCGGHAGGFIRYALRCGEMVGGDRPPLRGERKLSQSDPGWRRTLWAHSNRDWKQQHQAGRGASGRETGDRPDVKRAFYKRRTFYCPARHHRRWKNIGCRPGQRQKKQSGMGARHCSE